MSSYKKNLVFTAACIGMCFFGISMITLGSVLPSLTAKLGLDNLQATALVTFLPLGLLGGSLLFGPIVDRFGHKALLLLSCLVVLLGLEGIAFFTSIPLLQLSIIGIGLRGGILNGETNALVADISNEKEKGSRLSLLGAFYGIGALGIPVLLSFLSEHYSFEIILQGTGVVMLAGILFCLGVRFPAPKQPQGFPMKEGLGLLKESSLLLLSFILFFQSGIEGVCNNWTTLYLGQTTGIPGSPHQSDYGCRGLRAIDLLTRIRTCRHRYGADWRRTGIYVPRHTQYHRQPVRFPLGNGFQRGTRHRPHRTDIAEQPHGNHLTRIWHRSIPLHDDRLPAHHAPTV